MFYHECHHVLVWQEKLYISYLMCQCFSNKAPSRTNGLLQSLWSLRCGCHVHNICMAPTLHVLIYLISKPISYGLDLEATVKCWLLLVREHENTKMHLDYFLSFWPLGFLPSRRLRFPFSRELVHTVSLEMQSLV